MKLISVNKMIELTILGYEFPKIDQQTNYYDANWLMVQIKFKEEDYEEEIYKDSCVLTFELEKFLFDAKSIFRGEQNSCELEAFEPYLSIFLKRISKVEYNLKIEYIFNRKTGDKIIFDETLPNYEVEDFVDDLERQIKKLPVRK